MLTANKKKEFLFSFFIFFFSVPGLFRTGIPIKGMEKIPLWFINTDEDGNVYAASLNEYEIYKFSSEGELLFQIGRKGRDKGEIKRLSIFELNRIKKALFVPELPGGNKRISVFDITDGKYIGDYSIDLNWDNWSGILKIRFDSKGNAFIDAIKTKYKEEGYFRISGERNIIKFSPEGKYLGTMWRGEEEIQLSEVGRPSLEIPFRNYMIWDMWKDLIIVGESKSNIVKLFDTNGKILKNIILPFNREKIKKRDLERWIKWQKNTDYRIKNGLILADFLNSYYKRIKLANFKPLIYDLRFDKKGSIIAFKFTNYGEDKEQWVKINPKTGKEIKRIITSDQFLFIDENYIYVSRKLGEERIRYFKISREECGF